MMQPTDTPDLPASAPPDNAHARGNQPVYKRFLAHRARLVEGALLGALTGMSGNLLGTTGLIQAEVFQDIVLVPTIIGMLIAVSPARKLLRIAACAAVLMVFIVAYTPLTSYLVPSLVRSDPLQHAPAVVVLSSYLHVDNTLNAGGQERALQGYLLLRQRYADRLVLTNSVSGIGDQAPVIRGQMVALGLNYPVDEVGPVANTHDEAVAVARLAHQRGWKRVILVTQPWHMRRARALFIKAGLDVICSPCVEGGYDMAYVNGTGTRLHGFRNWLHETLGIAVYRLRGWL